MQIVNVYVINRQTNKRKYKKPIQVYQRALDSGENEVVRVGTSQAISLITYKLVHVDNVTEVPPYEPVSRGKH